MARKIFTSLRSMLPQALPRTRRAASLAVVGKRRQSDKSCALSGVLPCSPGMRSANSSAARSPHESARRAFASFSPLASLPGLIAEALAGGSPLAPKEIRRRHAAESAYRHKASAGSLKHQQAHVGICGSYADNALVPASGESTPAMKGNSQLSPLSTSPGEHSSSFASSLFSATTGSSCSSIQIPVSCITYFSECEARGGRRRPAPRPLTV